jgi:hypothetical protein
METCIAEAHAKACRYGMTRTSLSVPVSGHRMPAKNAGDRVHPFCTEGVRARHLLPLSRSGTLAAEGKHRYDRINY